MEYSAMTTLRSNFNVAIGACLVLAATGLAGCSPLTSGSKPGNNASPAGCAREHLKTLDVSRLTIGTDEPVYPPWFVDNRPDNGKGFEGAVAAAIASKLGYSPIDVNWVRVPFNNAIAPGKKSYDFDINEF